VGNTLEIFDYLLQHGAHADILSMSHATEPVMGKRDVIRENGSAQHIPLPSADDRATAPQNMYRNFVKFGRVVFEVPEWTDRQTDTQTHSSQYFAPLPPAK